MRQTETLTNPEYVPRVRELESQGAAYFTVKVLTHNLGYEISYALPDPFQSELILDNLPSK